MNRVINVSLIYLLYGEGDLYLKGLIGLPKKKELFTRVAYVARDVSSETEQKGANFEQS